MIRDKPDAFFLWHFLNDVENYTSIVRLIASLSLSHSHTLRVNYGRTIRSFCCATQRPIESNSSKTMETETTIDRHPN